MSERRPFTRGGRRLTVVRPRPFVPPPQVVQFWQLVRQPAAGVTLVLRANPSLLWMAGLLALVPSACLLWLTTALLFHLGCRALGAAGGFRQALQVSGMAMYAYEGFWLLICLLHWPTPNPGHVVLALWLTAVLYHAGRQIYALPVRGAALAAVLPIAAVGVGYMLSR